MSVVQHVSHKESSCVMSQFLTRDAAPPRINTGRPRLLERGSLFERCLNSLPTVVVLSGLASVAWWGHHHDWKLPKFAEIGTNQTKLATDWCTEHGVPESICVICQDVGTKKSKGFGWCKVHGVSECPLEHPEVAELTMTPEVSADRLKTVEEALSVRPRQNNNSICKTQERIIQVPSIESLEKTGIEIDVASEQPVVETIVANGQIIFDQTRTAHLSSRVPGTIWRVEKKLGDAVKTGDVLLLVDALEVGKTKSEFLKALSDMRLKKLAVERLAPLAGTGSVPGSKFLESEAALQEAEIRLLATQEALVNLGFPVKSEQFKNTEINHVLQQLKFVGIPLDDVSKLETAAVSSNLIPVISPVDGVVIETEAVRGEVIDTSTRLFTVADRNRLWITVDVPQQEVQYAKIGQTLVFKPDSSDSEIKGQLDWIADTIDEKTRTVKLRAQVFNDSRQIKAFSFGTGRIVLRETPNAIVVPNEAVHSDGCCQIVFVRNKDFLKKDSPKLFHVRKVRLGVKTAEHTEIIAGIMTGEVVATKGSEALRVELLKGNLGAGCGCGH